MLTCFEMENPGFHCENQWSVRRVWGQSSQQVGRAGTASGAAPPGLGPQPLPAQLTAPRGSRKSVEGHPPLERPGFLEFLSSDS